MCFLDDYYFNLDFFFVALWSSVFSNVSVFPDFSNELGYYNVIITAEPMAEARKIQVNL